MQKKMQKLQGAKRLYTDKRWLQQMYFMYDQKIRIFGDAVAGTRIRDRDDYLASVMNNNR